MILNNIFFFLKIGKNNSLSFFELVLYFLFSLIKKEKIILKKKNSPKKKNK